MANNHISDLSTTAASNTSVNGVPVEDAALVSTVDNMIRADIAVEKQTYEDLGGVSTVAGTVDAITVDGTLKPSALRTGQVFRFVPSGGNTGATTMNWNALGVKQVRKIDGGTDVAIINGDILESDYAVLIYDETANAAAGAWILANPKFVAGIDPDTAYTDVDQDWTAAQRPNVGALSSTSNSVAIDLTNGNDYTLTLSENTTLANPIDTATNVQQTGSIYIQQDGTGGRTLAFGSQWVQLGDTVPDVPSAASDKMLFTYKVISATVIAYDLRGIGV